MIIQLFSCISYKIIMRTSRLKKRLEEDYGTVPDFHYFDEDIGRIGTYFNHRSDNDLDDFLIDNITANDLNLDLIFKRLNNCQSMSGEQYLYYMLRSPCVSCKSYEKRRSIINCMQDKPETRLKIQLALARLGKNRQANVTDVFMPSKRKPTMLFFYIGLVLLFFISCAVMVLSFFSALIPTTLIPIFAFFTILINPIVYEVMSRKIERDLATVNYTVSMISAAKKLNKILDGNLAQYLLPMHEAANKLKSVLHIGGISIMKTGGFEDIIKSILLIDLISYELLKVKLGKYHKYIFIIHEHLGMIDAAISIASYRKSIAEYAEPNIDFDESSEPYYSSTNMVHPLVDNPIPNSFNITKSALVTGSNATGKSTFLKTVAINAIMAQSICTCLCQHYQASVFRIFSSMEIKDNLVAGESYYIAEIKSLKRILDYSNKYKNINLLCVIDEVLRGTNTVERIAASKEILKELTLRNILCVVATHDLELCSLLNKEFELYHFQEYVYKDSIRFDYKLNQGATKSKNAIQLLKLLGFGDELVTKAEKSANNYIKTGIWM